MSPRYQLVDLMGDCASYTPGPAARVVHIVHAEDGHFRVVENGRMADGLAFDEMLGQIVDLLHPKLGHGRYRMMSRDAIRAEEERRQTKQHHLENFA